MSCIGETAESRTSTTRLDFSSIVVVRRFWLPTTCDVKSRTMKAIGKRKFMTSLVFLSPSAVTVVECLRPT